MLVFTNISLFSFLSLLQDNLAEGRSCPEDDSFLYLDPRSGSGLSHNSSSSSKGEKYSDVIVFVLGGGCYSEFFNLQELLKDKGPGGSSSSGALRNIIYGCSELLSGDEFVEQLERLSQPKNMNADAKK